MDTGQCRRPASTGAGGPVSNHWHRHRHCAARPAAWGRVGARRVRAPTAVAPLEVSARIETTAAPAGDEAAAAETNAVVAAVVATPPPEQARAAVLRVAAVFAARESAQAEGMPRGSAK